MSKYAKLNIVEAKPKTPLQLWLETNGSSIKEARVQLHLGHIDPKDRESVARLGAPVTDLIRQQVDALQHASDDMVTVSERFNKLKVQLTKLFETLLPPKQTLLGRIFGTDEKALTSTEVRQGFDDVIKASKVCVNDAKMLDARVDRLLDTMPSISKQLDELQVAAQYLFTQVVDPDWVNRRLVAFQQSSNLHAVGLKQLETAKETVQGFITSVDDMQNSMMPTWKSISIEIALRRAANQNIDDSMRRALVNASNILNQK